MPHPVRRREEFGIALRALSSDLGFSGVIEEAAEGAELTIGAAVFGVADSPPRLGTRKLLLGADSCVASKPKRLGHHEAALLAKAGLQALQAVELARVGVGQQVLVTGAGSHLGALLVQIAKARGAHVTASCCDREVPIVWELGADVVRAEERAGMVVGSFDAVFELGRQARSESMMDRLGPEGRHVTFQGGVTTIHREAGAPGRMTPDSKASGASLRSLARLVCSSGLLPAPGLNEGPHVEVYS